MSSQPSQTVSVMKIWKDLLPVEMYWGSIVLLYPKFVQVMSVYYFLSTGIALIYFAFQINALIVDETPMSHIPRAVLLQIQNVAYVMMPYTSYCYCKDFVKLNVLRNLFQEIRVYDFHAPTKFQIISNLNVSLFIFAIVLYCVSLPLSPIILFFSVIFSVTYFAPYCWAYTFNIYIMEAFRIRAMEFSSQLKILIKDPFPEINNFDCESPLCPPSGTQSRDSPISNKTEINENLLEKCDRLGKDFEVNSEVKDDRMKSVSCFQIGKESSSAEERDQNRANPPSSSIPSPSEYFSQFNGCETSIVSNIRLRYVSYTRDCLYFSQRCGKHLLFLFGTALIFSIATVWGIYLDQENTLSTFPFVLISLNLVAQLGLSIASANETGHLICRDISTYLLLDPHGHHPSPKPPVESLSQLQCTVSFSQSLPILPSEETLLLLQCMQYSKLEIPFVGGFALRSKTILTILGSIVGAIIPGVILKT
jgi:hypothetical protein